MPARPKTAQAAASSLALATATDDDIQGWDDYLAEAAPDVTPFRKRLPNGELLEVPCPSAEQMEDLDIAQRRGDVRGMYLAMFGEDLADKLLDLTAKRPFTVRVKIVNDIMFHYGMTLTQLPNSDTSPS